MSKDTLEGSLDTFAATVKRISLSGAAQHSGISEDILSEILDKITGEPPAELSGCLKEVARGIFTPDSELVRERVAQFSVENNSEKIADLRQSLHELQQKLEPLPEFIRQEHAAKVEQIQAEIDFFEGDGVTCAIQQEEENHFVNFKRLGFQRLREVGGEHGLVITGPNDTSWCVPPASEPLGAGPTVSELYPYRHPSEIKREIESRAAHLPFYQEPKEQASELGPYLPFEPTEEQFEQAAPYLHASPEAIETATRQGILHWGIRKSDGGIRVTHVAEGTGAATKGEAIPELLSSLGEPKIRYGRMIDGGPVHPLFDACTISRDAYTVFIDGDQAGMQHCIPHKEKGRRDSRVMVYAPERVPLNLRNAQANYKDMESWVRARVSGPVDLLDDMAWDIANLALMASYERTEWKVYSDRFPLLADDYFDWRSMASSHRSPEARREFRERIDILCSIKVDAEVRLDALNPETGRKRRTYFGGPGPFLVKTLDLYRDGQVRLDFDGTEAPDGYMLTLGEWAKPFIEEHAMLGICVRALAEFDKGRQLWAARIGQYLVNQMTIQGSRMKFERSDPVDKAGITPLVVTPQQPLFMETILEGAHAGSFGRGTGSFRTWKEVAKENPGRVTERFLEALETLKKYRVIGPYSCMDAPKGGPIDGSELPIKGRLVTLLKRRWVIVPGPRQAEILYLKQIEAKEARKRAKDRKGARGTAKILPAGKVAPVV